MKKTRMLVMAGGSIAIIGFSNGLRSAARGRDRPLKRELLPRVAALRSRALHASLLYEQLSTLQSQSQYDSTHAAQAVP
jgi:hypothetical protein